MKTRIAWALYVLFLIAAGACVLKAAAARDREMMARFGGMEERR